MKRSHSQWLALACFVLLACWLAACSEDDTTCPPKVCPNPEGELLGTWTIFEAYQSDTPTPQLVGGQVIFEENDSVSIVVPSFPTLAYVWMADGEEILMANPGMTPPSFRFAYEFEADTLNMSEAEWDVRWRLHK